MFVHFFSYSPNDNINEKKFRSFVMNVFVGNKFLLRATSKMFASYMFETTVINYTERIFGRVSTLSRVRKETPVSIIHNTTDDRSFFYPVRFEYFNIVRTDIFETGRALHRHHVMTDWKSRRILLILLILITLENIRSKNLNQLWMKIISTNNSNNLNNYSDEAPTNVLNKKHILDQLNTYKRQLNFRFLTQVRTQVKIITLVII